MSQQIAQNNSYSTVVRSVTTRLSNSQYKNVVANYHRQADAILKHHNIKPSVSATFHELIKCVGKSGLSRVSQRTLSLRLRCSERTVRRHMQKFEELGLITKPKEGWQQSNRTTVLFIQHLNMNKQDKMSSNLTLSPREREEERRSALVERSQPEKKPEPELIALSAEEKAKHKQLLESLKRGGFVS